MTEEELKIKFDHIQGIFNRCINHASQVMIDNIASKSLYFDEEQADKLEQQEYVRTADELVQLYIRYSVLNDIPYFYSVSDFQHHLNVKKHDEYKGQAGGTSGKETDREAATGCQYETDRVAVLRHQKASRGSRVACQ